MWHAVRHVLVLVIALVGSAPLVHAQTTWPAHPIRLIVPYPAGGTTDVLARVLAERYGQAWGQPVVIDNRSGAAGLIGTEAAARAAPDGYTLVLGNNATHAANAALFPQARIDLMRDFVAVAFLASSRHALVVPAMSSARSIADLVALGRNRRLAFGSSGVGSASHLISEMLQVKSGMGAVHVPYRGAGPALADLLGGQFDFMTATWAGVAQQVATGQLRAIAMGGPIPGATGPAADIHRGAVTLSFAGQGWPELDLDAWFALFAPATTPASVLERLNTEAAHMLADRSVADRLRAIGFEPKAMALPELARFFPDEVNRWGAIVRVAGVRLDQALAR
jgi:tripartite-type tricarboxylate transporter receptor subunit TctC